MWTYLLTDKPFKALPHTDKIYTNITGLWECCPWRPCPKNYPILSPVLSVQYISCQDIDIRVDQYQPSNPSTPNYYVNHPDISPPWPRYPALISLRGYKWTNVICEKWQYDMN